MTSEEKIHPEVDISGWKALLPDLDKEEGQEQEEASQEEQQQEEETPPGGQALSAEDEKEETEEEEEYYRLSKKNLYQEIAKLAEEDPQFRNILKTYQGRRTAREYEAKIAALEAQLRQYELQNIGLLVDSLSDEEIAERYANDSEFAQALDAYYDALTNEQGSADPRAAAEEVKWRTKIEEAFDWAASMGVSEERIRQLQAAIAPGGCQNCRFIAEPHGVLDHDAEGNEIWPVDALDTLRSWLAADVAQALQQRQAQAPAQRQQQAPQSPPRRAQEQEQAQAQAQTPPPPPPAPQPRAQQRNADVRQQVPEPRTVPPILDTANPDLSPTGLAPGVRMTLEEVYRLPAPEFVRLFPNEGDLERAIQAGQVIVER